MRGVNMRGWGFWLFFMCNWLHFPHPPHGIKWMLSHSRFSSYIVEVDWLVHWISYNQWNYILQNYEAWQQQIMQYDTIIVLMWFLDIRHCYFFILKAILLNTADYQCIISIPLWYVRFSASSKLILMLFFK